MAKIIDAEPVLATIQTWKENAVKRGDCKDIILAYDNCMKRLEIEPVVNNEV